jgi:hypothetical protein
MGGHPGRGVALAGLAGIALLHDPSLCAGRIAQLVEQLTLNQRVPGSSPGAPTTRSIRLSYTFREVEKSPFG